MKLLFNYSHCSIVVGLYVTAFW